MDQLKQVDVPLNQPLLTLGKTALKATMPAPGGLRRPNLAGKDTGSMFSRLRFTDLTDAVLVVLLAYTMAQLLSTTVSLTWIAAGLLALPALLMLTAIAMHRLPRTERELPPALLGSSHVDGTPSSAALRLAADSADDWCRDDDANSEGLLVQSWRRRVAPDGSESVSGEALVPFAAGEKVASVHIPWQPPLAGPPTVWTEVVDGDEADVQVDVVRPYGMRLLVRRLENVEQTGSTRIEFYGATSDEMRAAA